MKIEELNQNAGVAYVAGGRTDKAEAAEVSGEAAAKPQAGSDKVELSSYMPVVTQTERQDGLRVSRVEELKAQLASGSYQVPARAVAEKMLAKFSQAAAAA